MTKRQDVWGLQYWDDPSAEGPCWRWYAETNCATFVEAYRQLVVVPEGYPWGNENRQDRIVHNLDAALSLSWGNLRKLGVFVQ